MNFQPFLALEASAGSGKTFALSVRFVALILKGARLNEILAITFTRKAASEMKSRIIETFLHLESKDNELAELCSLLGKDKADILALRDARKSEFLRAELKISTFDSFFSRMVRAFALNLGLMSDFEIKQNETQAQAEFISLLSESQSDRLARYVDKIQSKASFFRDLDFLYRHAYANLHESVNFPQKELESVNFSYKNLRNEALKMSEVFKNEGIFKDKEAGYFESNFKLESVDITNINELLGKPIICEFDEKKYFKKTLENESFIQKRNALMNALDTYANALERYKIGIWMGYFDSFKRAKNAVIARTNTLSHTDIAVKAHELAAQNELKELIYFRLDGFIAHLLIDEFQDTSVLQYEILKPLIAELVSGKGTRDFRSFFYVGDKKQSIYRFRQGRKELFDLLQADFPQIVRQSLDTNYRSKDVLVSFINENFGRLYAQGYLEQKSVKNGGFVSVCMACESENLGLCDEKSGESALKNSENGNLSLKNGFENSENVLKNAELNEGLKENAEKSGVSSQKKAEKKPKKASKDELFASSFAKLCEIITLLRSKDVKDDDICILCWQNKDADRLVAELSSIKLPSKDGTPTPVKAYTQSSIVLDSKDCVCLVLNYLKFSIFGDKFYYEVLKSLLPQSEIKPLKFELFARPSEILMKAATTLRLDIAQSAMAQLFELALTKENIFELLFDELTQTLANDENKGICVMTVHKSKGLEFEHLIVMDELSGQGSELSELMLEFSPKNRAWQLKIKDKMRKFTQNASYTAFLAQKEGFEQDERLNTLYVAMTRAKSSLFVIKNASSGYFAEFECGEWGVLSECARLADEENADEIDFLEPFEKISTQKSESKKATQGSKELYFGNAFHLLMQNVNFKNFFGEADLKSDFGGVAGGFNDKMNDKMGENSVNFKKNSQNVGIKGENLLDLAENSVNFFANLSPKMSENFKKAMTLVRNDFRFLLDEDDFLRLENIALKLLSNADFKGLLKGKECYKERDLIFENERKTLDLLCVSDDEAVIFDYKTGESYQKSHEEQISLYKKAITNILQKPSTRAFLVYCLDNGITLKEI